MNISLQQVIGFTIRTIDGEYGTVSDFLFSSKDHVIRYLVVDPQKWNPLSQKLLVSPVSVYYINIDSQEVCLSIDTNKLKAAPGLEDHETVSRHFEAELYRYYGYGYYWMGADLWGMSSDPTLLKTHIIDDQPDSELSEDDIPLRSINEVCTYLVSTQDNKHHHLSDFILNTKSWNLQFAVINAQNGLISTERCLINVAAISEYSWHQQLVKVAVSSAQVLGNPHYNANLINSEQFLSMMELSPIELEKNPE
ncbi:PRC-barrel domain-containing protein [Psychrosphaera sp.]|nr:PRC-barrel domain-containing protein [Psychrosphaera sp.]